MQRKKNNDLQEFTILFHDHTNLVISMIMLEI